MRKYEKDTMKTYHFTIVLEVMTNSTPGHEDRLYEAGCDDAFLCAYGETLYLEFDRESTNAKHAVQSAIDNIESAGAKVRSIQEGGYSSKADIASFAGVTRAAINKYFQNLSGFPSPVFGITSRSPLYSMPEVAVWLFGHKKIEKEKLEVTLAASSILHHGAKDIDLSSANLMH